MNGPTTLWRTALLVESEWIEQVAQVVRLGPHLQGRVAIGVVVWVVFEQAICTEKPSVSACNQLGKQNEWSIVNIETLYAVVGRIFRTKRLEKFVEHFGVNGQTRILDVGGTPFNWTLLTVRPSVILVNISPIAATELEQVVADGCRLPFRDGEFDIVFSNSVIEHLYSLENQQRFAAECQRTGRMHYMQTPNKWFPVEPHYITLFIHWLPKRIRRRLVRHFSLRGWLTRPSQRQCDRMVEEIRLLTADELKGLFPASAIWPEKFLFLTKSFVVAKLKPDL
ncbi:MAG: hypothetical protein DCC55_20690 [Chloroflexi bacterium]|nr:MAG: hypothetical protein DCC55_20690 [Chloroflexota bacterium]